MLASMGNHVRHGARDRSNIFGQKFVTDSLGKCPSKIAQSCRVYHHPNCNPEISLRLYYNAEKTRDELRAQVYDAMSEDKTQSELEKEVGEGEQKNQEEVKEKQEKVGLPNEGDAASPKAEHEAKPAENEEKLAEHEAEPTPDEEKQNEHEAKPAEKDAEKSEGVDESASKKEDITVSNGVTEKAEKDEKVEEKHGNEENEEPMEEDDGGSEAWWNLGSTRFAY